MKFNTYLQRSILFFTLSTTLGFYANAEAPLRGFGQVGYTASDSDNNGETDNANQFYNGALDLFISTNISKKVTFLSEVAFEMDSSNSTVTDIERLMAQYTVSPWLKVAAGRFHTALGYWNDNYHHGSWLHASADRPLVYHFEDDNGILPVHAEGIEVRGEGDMGPGQLGYIFNVANGRGAEIDPPQVVNDGDHSKAMNLLVYYSLPNHLRVGAVYYTDNLPGCRYDLLDANQACGFTQTSGAGMKNKGAESIYGIHAVYNPEAYEVLVEYFNMSHDYDTENTTATADADVTAGYVQFAYHMGDLTPYYRYDMIEVPSKKTDAYTGLDGTKVGHTVGARYDLDATNALKLEYYTQNLEHADKTKDTWKSATANWSFTF